MRLPIAPRRLLPPCFESMIPSFSTNKPEIGWFGEAVSTLKVAVADSDLASGTDPPAAEAVARD